MFGRFSPRARQPQPPTPKFSVRSARKSLVAITLKDQTMSYLLAFARLLWHPIYVVTRPFVRALAKIQVGKIRETDLISEQINLFHDLGLDWVSANRFVTEVVGLHRDFKSHRSQHYELVAAIAQTIKPKRILEIGTADASFTSFLARVFPDSLVETIDLPVTDQRFWNATDEEPRTEKPLTSEFKNELSELEVRLANLKSSPNIVFREMNSLGLSLFEEHKFDLIWVDGDHTFPVVACDFVNAVRLLASGGKIMCDDIYLSDGRKSRWGSHESRKVLTAFERAKIVRASYVLKSIRPEKNYSLRVKKHLAVVELIH